MIIQLLIEYEVEEEYFDVFCEPEMSVEQLRALFEHLAKTVNDAPDCEGWVH